MIIYLLPPSEGKNDWGIDAISSRTFDFSLPLEIAEQVTMKDLKCKGERYEQGVALNKNIKKWVVLPAIQRYSGVMYKAIWVESMQDNAKKYFHDHVLILSWMYWILKPSDTIANYKLPIDTKWLRAWRGDTVTDALIEYGKEFEDLIIVDLLSGAYQKMLDPKKFRESWIKYHQVHFMKEEDWARKKYTHWVKKVKGEKLREWCEYENESRELLKGEELIEVVV